jgi:hypothetical protein
MQVACPAASNWGMLTLVTAVVGSGVPNSPKGAKLAAVQPLGARYLIEPGADLRHRQRTQPSRCQLQGQRNPVQPYAHRRNRRGVGRVKGEALPVHRGALREQLHRLKSGQLAGGGQIGRRDWQRRNPENMLPADAQRLAAGDQQVRTRSGGPHRGPRYSRWPPAGAGGTCGLAPELPDQTHGRSERFARPTRIYHTADSFRWMCEFRSCQVWARRATSGAGHQAGVRHARRS